MTESLTSKFDALHAEREKTWPPEKLRHNVETRRALVDAFDASKIVKVGDTVPPFSLQLSDGASIDLDALTNDGPIALVFFRFAGCPACNIALPHYDDALRPSLDAAGIRLLGVSPHLPERGLGDIRQRHGLGYEVASDRDNALARQFGLTFIPPDNPAVPADDPSWIGALTGTGSWELPQPAIVIIDQDHIVRFVNASPDWLRRTEADTVLQLINGASMAAAA
jgi:peroxiredoxin